VTWRAYCTWPYDKERVEKQATHQINNLTRLVNAGGAGRSRPNSSGAEDDEDAWTTQDARELGCVVVNSQLDAAVGPGK